MRGPQGAGADSSLCAAGEAAAALGPRPQLPRARRRTRPGARAPAAREKGRSGAAARGARAAQHPPAAGPHFVLRVGGALAARALPFLPAPEKPTAGTASGGPSSGHRPSRPPTPGPARSRSPCAAAPLGRLALAPRRLGQARTRCGAVRGREAAPPRNAASSRHLKDTGPPAASRPPLPPPAQHSSLSPSALRPPSAPHQRRLRQEASLKPRARWTAHAPGPAPPRPAGAVAPPPGTHPPWRPRAFSQPSSLPHIRLQQALLSGPFSGLIMC